MIGTYAVIPYSVLTADRARARRWIASSTAGRWQDAAIHALRVLVLRWRGSAPDDLPGDLPAQGTHADVMAWLAAQQQPDEDDTRVYRRALGQDVGGEPVPDRYVVLTVAQAAGLSLRVLRDVWEHAEAVEASGRLYLLVPVSGDLSSIDGGWGLPAGLDVSGRQTRTLAYVEGYLDQYDGPTRRAWRGAFREAVEALL